MNLKKLYINTVWYKYKVSFIGNIKKIQMKSEIHMKDIR